MRIAAIDQGTTSTRVVVAGPDAPPRTVLTASHRQIYPQAGWVEHDPDELLDNITRCLNAAGPVDAIGIDNQGESCLAWDRETMQALGPVIVWQDSRTQDRIEAMQAEGLEAETLARAGLPLDPYFSASKLAWILGNNPEAVEAHRRGTLCLGTTDAFFLHRLTGHFVTDITTASRTSLMNLERGEWDPELCRIFGVPIEALPAIVPTTGDFGAVRTDHGLIPVTASIVDQQAALYGVGCSQPGDTKITFGTGAFALMVTGGQIVRKPEQGLLPTVAWQKSGQVPVYALDGGVYTASAAVNWARDLGLFASFDQINAFDQPPALSRGLAFVPALAGLACPHWDRRARGAWLGLSLDHGGLDLCQAILEGVACRAAEVVRAMADATGHVPDQVRIDGGMSANPYFGQFLADVLGCMVRPAQSAEMTALGTAALAAEAAGGAIDTANSFGEIPPGPTPQDWLVRFETALKLSQQWR